MLKSKYSVGTGETKFSLGIRDNNPLGLLQRGVTQFCPYLSLPDIVSLGGSRIKIKIKNFTDQEAISWRRLKNLFEVDLKTVKN